jgi:ABC-type uncharacterized transport system auxiliary subunit
MRVRYALLALAFAAPLSACVSLLPETQVPLALISLPAERARAPATPLAADVSVLPPDSSRAFAGVDIAVSDNQELVYLGDVRWADTAPRLLQGAVVDALSKSGGPGRATTFQQGVRGDYELRWRIVDLSVGKETLPVRVEVTAILVNAETRRTIAQGTFKAEGNLTPATHAPRDRAAALALAAQNAADQVANFVATNAKAIAPATPR